MAFAGTPEFARAALTTLAEIAAGFVIGAGLGVVALAGAPTGARGAPFAEELATGPGHVFGGLDMPLGVALSATSAFLALVVTLVTALVQVYSAWYLADDDRRGAGSTGAATGRRRASP